MVSNTFDKTSAQFVKSSANVGGASLLFGAVSTLMCFCVTWLGKMHYGFTAQKPYRPFQIT